jgi:hypothetical protein
MIHAIYDFDIMSSKEKHGGIIRPRLKRRRISYRDKRPAIKIEVKNLEYKWMLCMDRIWHMSGITNLIPYIQGREDECCLTNYVQTGKVDGIVYKSEGPRCPFDLLSETQLESVIEISRKWSLKTD